MDVINNKLRSGIFTLIKNDYDKLVWEVFTKYYKDFEKLEYDGDEYILLRSDCKNFFELIINDVGNDYSIGLSSYDDELSSIGSYDSDRDEDWVEF